MSPTRLDIMMADSPRFFAIRRLRVGPNFGLFQCRKEIILQQSDNFADSQVAPFFLSDNNPDLRLTSAICRPAGIFVKSSVKLGNLV